MIFYLSPHGNNFIKIVVLSSTVHVYVYVAKYCYVMYQRCYVIILHGPTWRVTQKPNEGGGVPVVLWVMCDIAV